MSVDVRLSNVRLSETTNNHILHEANIMIKKIENNLNKNVYVDIVICGSIAKGTALEGDSDIDIFVRFERDLAEDEIPKIIRRLSRDLCDREKIGDGGIKYGTYPYIEFIHNEIKYNIVSCYYCHNIYEIKSTTDRTPFHTKFMNENLTERQKDDVCKLKKLCKEELIYGANDDINGFSGYVCETLIHTHEDLVNLLNRYASIDDSDRDKLLDITDPVDETRELSSAISGSSFGKFIEMARKQTGRAQPVLPEHVYGFDKESCKLRQNFLAERTLLIHFGISSKPIILRKMKEIRHILADSGFKVLYIFAYELYGCVVLESITIPKYYLRDRIMNVASMRACEKINFVNFNNTIKLFIGNDLMYNSIERRKFTNAQELLREHGFRVLEMIEFDELVQFKITETFTLD